MTPILFPATCLLAVGEVDLTQTPTGWQEQAHLEVLAQTRCPWVDVVLPRGASLVALTGAVRPSDGGRRDLVGPRREWRPRDRDGRTTVRLHTPDALAGDAIWIDITRTLPPEPYSWSIPARYLATTLDGKEAALTNVPHPLPSTPVESRLAPDPVSTAAFTQTLLVPGDPLRTLYPGAGSSVRHEWAIDTPAQDAPSSLLVDVPREAEQVVVEGAHVRYEANVELLIEPGQPTHHTVTFLTADAPTHGRRAVLPGAEVDHRVTLDKGRVRWEDEHWTLTSIDFQAITPDRPILVNALDRRFRRAMMPEPALPTSLKGTEPSRELVEQLQSILWRRAGVAPLPLDPLFPRRLRKARRSGAITPLEATLILGAQLGQAGARASWGLLSLDAEPAVTSLDGYTEAILPLLLDGNVVYVDPGCTVCAAFEVRPHLQGRVMLSPVGTLGPPVVSGAFTVTDTDTERTVRLLGPAALLLRERLADQAKELRSDLLAAWLGGEGAVFVGSEGLGDRGDPITVVLTSPTRPDVLELLGPDWTGERTWIRPPSPPAEESAPLPQNEPEPTPGPPDTPSP